MTNDYIGIYIMDKETAKFIVEQNQILKDDLKEIIHATSSGVRAKIESEVNRIDEMDKFRNGRIGKTEDDICEIQSETRAWRWIQRNPKVAIIVFVITVASIAIGAHSVNVKRTIEKVTKIQLNETD